MQIILVHQRLSQARTFTFGKIHLVLCIVALGAVIIVGALLLNLLAMETPAALDLPGVRNFVQAANQGESERKDKYLRENLNAMAVKLGEMQAQVTRLEALGERVSGLAGIKPQEFNLKDSPPRGGAAPVAGGREISVVDFQSQLAQLAQDVERRSDLLNVVESSLMSAKLKSKMMPTIQPVNVAYNSSGFGWRIDPFNGREAMHAGIDFVAATGTPIVAAAGGVVIASEWHHDFGNMIEIDHGNDITTLYAHTSKVYVRVGDIVRRNQHIADVGSTGRATGSHLHFEVHVKGVPQNPAKFLDAGGAPPSEVAAAATNAAD